jgi:hypothetical protein
VSINKLAGAIPQTFGTNATGTSFVFREGDTLLLDSFLTTSDSAFQNPLKGIRAATCKFLAYPVKEGVGRFDFTAKHFLFEISEEKKSPMEPDLVNTEDAKPNALASETISFLSLLNGVSEHCPYARRIAFFVYARLKQSGGDVFSA